MSDLENKMIALIMIGGQSRRMGGGIKSFIEFNNKSIFDRILERTKPQIKKIIVNCNAEETSLKKYQLPIIKDIKKGYLGPLAGIHSAMDFIRKNDDKVEWLVTLPGDTPFIPDNFINKIKDRISSKSKIILVKSNYKIHPIIGAWHLSLFKDLNMHLDLGIRKILSWANLHPIDFITFSDDIYDPFFNINTKEDINEAIKIEKENFSKKTNNYRNI